MPDRKRLPELDREFLEEKGYPSTVVEIGGALHVVISNFELSSAYTPQQVDLLIILPAGYPNAIPDMFWTNPTVKLTSGGMPRNADFHETYNGRSWQRWSRHNTQKWRPGVDSLRSHWAAIRRELAKGI